MRRRRPFLERLQMRREAAEQQASGDLTLHELDHDGRTRRFFVRLPKSAPPDQKLPVVLNFHGGMGDAFVQQRQSRMDDAAESLGFAVVYPEGTGRLPGRLLTYNAGSCCGYAQKANIDDVGFVRALIDRLPDLYPVDPTRIYAAGMSNGGMLCHRLGCELSDRLAAIASVAGDLGVDGPAPSRPVPVIQFHGMLDQNAPFDGGVGANQFQPNPHRSVAETMDFWIRANRCRPEPHEERQGDYIRRAWGPAPGEPGAPVVLYAFPRGGHTWPGGEDVTAHLNTGPFIASVPASRLILEFFSRFSL